MDFMEMINVVQNQIIRLFRDYDVLKEPKS